MISLWATRWGSCCTNHMHFSTNTGTHHCQQRLEVEQPQSSRGALWHTKADQHQEQDSLSLQSAPNEATKPRHLCATEPSLLNIRSSALESPPVSRHGGGTRACVCCEWDARSAANGGAHVSVSVSGSHSPLLHSQSQSEMWEVRPKVPGRICWKCVPETTAKEKNLMSAEWEDYRPFYAPWQPNAKAYRLPFEMWLPGNKLVCFWMGSAAPQSKHWRFV